MAASPFETLQYSAEDFVESCGAIIILKSERKICLLHHESKDEWLLAKGRRNVAESREAAALREVKEETGHRCKLLPITMRTRAPPSIETRHYPDEPRLETNVCDPFMVTCRYLDDEMKNLKIIWWYIAVAEGGPYEPPTGMGFRPKLLKFDEALGKLTYETDREVLRKAIEIFEHTVDDRYSDIVDQSAGTTG